jgi:hypothetical protein
MRGDVVYEIYGVHEGRKLDHFLGAFRTFAEAEAEIARLRIREMNGRNWAEQYHNGGFVIRESVVATDFEIPPRPKPRDRYFVRGTPQEYGPGTWPGSVVEVFQRADAGGESVKVCEYERNYALLQTFEPFRQGGRDFALISPHYTGTSVLDLATGNVIAAEPVSAVGFCPIGFYVPDWWDVHGESIIPGSKHWSADQEWPRGDFGIVWGCVWGDDSSWKVQHLDLSGIPSGVIRREERFGYIELAIEGYRSPCFDSEQAPPPAGTPPPPFIRLERWEGKTNVTFSVEMQFDFDSGQPTEWQRRKIADFE